MTENFLLPIFEELPRKDEDPHSYFAGRIGKNHGLLLTFLVNRQVNFLHVALASPCCFLVQSTYAAQSCICDENYILPTMPERAGAFMGGAPKPGQDFYAYTEEDLDNLEQFLQAVAAIVPIGLLEQKIEAYKLAQHIALFWSTVLKQK